MRRVACAAIVVAAVGIRNNIVRRFRFCAPTGGYNGVVPPQNAITTYPTTTTTPFRALPTYIICALTTYLSIHLFNTIPTRILFYALIRPRHWRRAVDGPTRRAHNKIYNIITYGGIILYYYYAGLILLYVPEGYFNLLAARHIFVVRRQLPVVGKRS